MIRGLIAFIVIFLVATFPATWLLMLFLGNVGVARQLLGHAAARHPRVGAARRRLLAQAHRGLIRPAARRLQFPRRACQTGDVS